MDTEKPIREDPKLILYVDGASRGNPGQAGAGVSIRDPGGEKVIEVSRYLGHRTNNEAEYEALLLGLREAKRIGAKTIRIYTDSELIERQIKGTYRVKEIRLRRLYQKVLKLLGGFTRVEIEAIPREENKEADLLANRAIERRLSSEIKKRRESKRAG